MDPLSVTTTIGAVAQTADYALNAATTLYKLIKGTRNVNNTVRLLAGEVESLGNAYKAVYEKLQAVARDYDSKTEALEPDAQESLRSLWTIIEAQIKCCDETIDTLQICIQIVKNGSSNAFKQGLRQFKLNLKSAEIETIRSRVQTHTIALQLFLQTLNMLVYVL